MKQVIDITKPKIFIAENVKGLVNLGDVKLSFSKISLRLMITVISYCLLKSFRRQISVFRSPENVLFS